MTTPSAELRTVERCEVYLDKLADLIVEAGNDWTVYQPLVERLERECQQAKEALIHARTHAQPTWCPENGIVAATLFGGMERVKGI